MRRSILLVDDEPAILLPMRAILEQRGFSVETASSASEAGQKLQARTFDLVITDMKMETDLAGFTVVRAARQQQLSPVIAIITAYADLGNDWKQEGADALWLKPLKIEDLLETVETLLT